MKAMTEKFFKKVIQAHSEDLHLMPRGDHYDLAYRHLGKLVIFDHLSIEEGERWLRYLKYLSNMNVSEKRKPQDGSLIYRFDDQSVELRLSTISNYLMQESLVIRFLYASEIEEKGKLSAFEENLLPYVRKKSGLLLFTGPVSSGKTTLMYKLLERGINKEEKQVITMENPVEIKEPAFLQTEVNALAGITYEALIRASLRHHPDILLIGEIRDKETAHWVIRAALTGHLVLATLHAKNTQGALIRMLEMEITPGQLEQTLLFVSSQRLVPLKNGKGMVAIYEGITSEEVSFYLTTHHFTDSFKSLNQALDEAVNQGLISRKSAEEFSL